MRDETISELVFWVIVIFGIYYIINFTDVTFSEVTDTGFNLIKSIINYIL